MPQETATTAKENNEAEKKTGDVEALRAKCKVLIDKKGEDNQISSEEDVAENRAWLESNPASRDPKELRAFIANYEKAVALDKDLLHQWEEKLNRMAKSDDPKKPPLLAAKSISDYVAWFRKQKTGKKMEYLKKSDLDDSNREKTVSEFMAAIETAGKVPGISAGKLQMRFANADLQNREKIVAELKKKSWLIASGVLPTIVRAELWRRCIDASEEKCAQLVAEAQHTHNIQKARFVDLSPVIQEEVREEFKKMLLPAREAFLIKLEKELQEYEGRYSGKMHQKQQPDKTGLNLFSNRPESESDSSAAKYMDWFKNKLTRKGMRDAINHDDLDRDERSEKRDEMAKILTSKPQERRAALISKFNAAELSGRSILILEQQKEARTGSGPGEGEKKGVLRTLLRRLLLSSQHEEVGKTMETFSVVNEITERRKRFKLAHHVRDKTASKAHEEGLAETLDETKKLEQNTTLDPLREKDGGIRVKLDTLESHKDARTQWKQVLKPNLGDPNVKLSADMTLRTRTGEEVIDERQYQQGELRGELDRVKDAITPLLQQEARAHGLGATEKETQEVLDGADWKHLGDEVIRKAA